MDSFPQRSVFRRYILESNGLFKSIKRESLMETVAAAIVNSRFIIFVLFALAAIYCALSINKVKVNEDITAFLPDSTETRLDRVEACHDYETTYVYTYYITDSIL